MNRYDHVIIDLYRHGAVDGPPALYGHTDILPSAQGGRALVRHLNHNTSLQSIVTSPLRRCKNSATEYAETGEVALDTDLDFMEMNFGDWDGVPFDTLLDQKDELMNFWSDPSRVTPPNGEKLVEFRYRVLRGWDRLIADPMSAHIGLVVHGGVIRLILSAILDIDYRNPKIFSQLSIDYASQTRIEISHYDGDAFPIVKFINKPAPDEEMS
ncbi:histidine phosphatase family protein [Sneathiella aquimaris]|uniref:histidine phosphatase family protein n=1 Tax=Sneathiella aquimaris TaxID=2599305 RepID=UPI00146E3EF0|nr:histidine phosphatase family protein [Sneathiella aquimaris]